MSSKPENPATIERALIDAARFAASCMTDQPVNSVSIARNGDKLRVMTWTPDGRPICATITIGDE